MSLGYPRSNSFFFIFACLALSVVCLPNDGHAQPVPVTDIENAAGDSVLTSFEDGGFAVFGEEGTGAIPIEGEGTRLMWHPAKAAFRAGEVTGAQWDEANVGEHSVAFGLDTDAAGVRSTAMGLSSSAEGNGSTAMGNGTLASGTGAVAMGNLTRAEGDESTSMGDRTEAATGQSLSIGRNNDANTSADNTLFVAGNGSFSNRSDALVLDYDGNMTIAGTLTENSDRRLKEQIQPLGTGVLGNLGEIEPVRFQFKDERTHPSGEQVGLIAQEVQAQFPALVSEGASGYLSVSYSKFTAVLLKGLQEQQAEIERLEARQAEVASLRKENEAIKKRLARLEQEETDEATYAGWDTSAPLGGLVALLLLVGGVVAWRRFDALLSIKTLSGLGATGLLVIGVLLAAPAGEARAQPTSVTEIENAAGDSVLTVNAEGGFAVYGEGTAGFVNPGPGEIPAVGGGARMMWYPAKAAFRVGEVGSDQWDDANIGLRSVAFGSSPVASGRSSTAMGLSTDAIGNGSTAMGSSTEASGSSSTAMGDNAEASGISSTAMGNNTIASGDESTAMGLGSTASGDQSTAMGDNATASGGESTAMGFNTEASGDFSTAMGNSTTAATANSFSIGNDNTANQTADNTAFVVGNGGNPDALVLDFDGNMTLAGGLTENSDRRLKEQIQPLGTAVLDPLGEIEPVRFHFKDERTHPSGEQIGLIAQEVQARFPALVSEGASGYLSVSYSKFTAVLLKGLQEQQVEIDRLEAKVNRMDQLEARLAKLEQQDTSRLASLGEPWSAVALLALGLLGLGLFVQRQQRA